MLCFACNSQFDDVNSLITHISRVHLHLQLFYCVENNCFRKFSLWNSYKKHLIAKHHGTNISESTTTSSGVNLNSNTANISNVTSESMPSTSLNPTSSETPRTDLFNLQTENHSNENLTFQQEKTIDPTVAFLAKLYSYSDVPLKRLNSIIDDFDNFFCIHLEPLEKMVCSKLKDLGESNDGIRGIESCFKNVTNSLKSDFSSGFLRLKKFEEVGTFIRPVQILLGERDDYKVVDGVKKLKKVKTTAEFIPIRHVFKTFFEIPEVYSRTMSYYDSLLKKDTVISNFVQSSIWQESLSKSKNKTLLPLFLFYDDYENNNPLGSHAGVQKCGAVYLSIPCLPPELASKLQSIFLFILFNSLDLKLFKKPVIFQKILAELRFLENEGILVQVESKQVKIYFKLSLILGDNLGVHGILGFTESFNANFPCRFCISSADEFQNVFEEIGTSCRSKSNYDEQVLINDSRKTGIIEKCLFHELDFHVTENICADAMHDILEGVCQYDLAKILHHFIFTEKYFSLAELNDRVNGFNYNKWDNKPPEISEIHLKNFKLKMSSSEMMTFTKNLGLYIGDFVPKDSFHWTIYIKLKEILDIILCNSFHPSLIEYFRIIISEYLETVQSIFPNTFKPKHHYLIHYPRIMSKVGPLWKCSSMRFESKHRVGKRTSHVSICRINVCRTISVRNQLKLSYDLLCQQFFPNPWKFGPSFSLQLQSISDSGLLETLQLFENKVIRKINWAQYRNKKISSNSVLVYPVVNESVFELEFFEVKMICSIDDCIHFIVSKIENVFFHEHFQAYRIFDSAPVFRIIPFKDLEDCFTFSSLHRLNRYLYVAKNF